MGLVAQQPDTSVGTALKAPVFAAVPDLLFMNNFIFTAILMMYIDNIKILDKQSQSKAKWNSKVPGQGKQ